MPILRTLEARVFPGKRQQWGAAMLDVKKIVDKYGSPLRVLQLQFGGYPGTVLSSSLADDWQALAARTQQVNADSDYQAFLKRGAMAELAETVEVRLANDISVEVGGPSESLASAQVIQVMASRILPGRRAKQIEMIRQMREARSAAGRPTANVLELVAGQAGVLLLAWGYPDLNAWATDRDAGQPKGAQDILQRVLADPEFPFVENLSTRVYSDITNQL
jgi:hypothetical protein